MKQSDHETGLMERLAVIENKLETLIDEVGIIREHVPEQIVQHAERISVLERGLRTMQWIAGLIATATIGAFVAHVLGR
jgi:hypothetical protein